jgi:phosphatidylinositol alpha 1,6-mannosyltransferase
MERQVTPESIRIAFFSPSMKPGQDGVTQVLYTVSEKLRERGIDHVFFTAVPPPRAEQPVPMHKVPAVAVPFYPDYKLSVGADFKVASVLASFQPDILCVNSPCSLGWAAVYNAKLHHRPIVAYYHTHFISYAHYYKVDVLTQLGWHYMRSFYNSVHETFVPSQPILNELREHRIRNLSLLPHGVDTDAFSPRHAASGWKRDVGVDGKLVLLYVGRLVWEKNLGVLAAAYRLIRRERDDVALVLVGDGPARAELEHLLPDAIFAGYRSGTALAAAYASADVFVFPSTTETFGMVTLEAMASGLAPVCANKGGAADIIRNGENGMLADPGSADDFAACCLRVIADASLRRDMSARALAFATQQSWDAVVARMLDEYCRVVQRVRGKRKRGKRGRNPSGM